MDKAMICTVCGTSVWELYKEKHPDYDIAFSCPIAVCPLCDHAEPWMAMSLYCDGPEGSSEQHWGGPPRWSREYAEMAADRVWPKSGGEGFKISFDPNRLPR